MKDSIFSVVEKIIEEQGMIILSNPLLFENLLKDLAPGEKTETSLLVNSIKEDLPQRIIKMKDIMDDQQIIDQLSQDFSSIYLLQNIAAEWVIKLWLQVIHKIHEPPQIQIQQRIHPSRQVLKKTIVRLRSNNRKTISNKDIEKKNSNTQLMLPDEYLYELQNKNILLATKKKIYCFDEQLGKTLWSFVPKGEVINQILVSSDSFLVLTDQSISRIHCDDGKVFKEVSIKALLSSDNQVLPLRKQELPKIQNKNHPIETQNVLINGKAFLIMYNEFEIYAIDPKTAKRTPIKNFNCSLINVLRSNEKIIAITSKSISCIDETDFEEIWAYSIVSQQISPPLLSEDCIILHQLNSKSGSTIRFIDINTGTEGNKYSFKNSQLNSIFANQNKLFASTRQGELYEFDLSQNSKKKVEVNNILPDVELLFLGQYMTGSNSYLAAFTKENSIFFYDFYTKSFVGISDDFTFNEMTFDPLFVNQNIIISTNSQRLICFNYCHPDRIIINWSKGLKSSIVWEIESYMEVIAFVTRDNFIHLYNSTTGSLKWERQVKHIISKPIIHNSFLYVVTSHYDNQINVEKLLCLNLGNGNIAFESELS